MHAGIPLGGLWNVRRCKVSEAAVALALIGQGGKLYTKQGARSICGFGLALASLLPVLGFDWDSSKA